MTLPERPWPWADGSGYRTEHPPELEEIRPCPDCGVRHRGATPTCPNDNKDRP